MTFKPPKHVLPSLYRRLLAVVFIFPLFAFAQDAPEKPVPEKAAVYAFGASDVGINKSLGGKLLAEFAQSGKYAEIADHHTFQEELAKSGNNSIGNVTQAAKRHGADLVCAVNIVEVFGAYSITASMVKTSDSQVIKTASLDRSLKSLSDITAVSKELAAQLLSLPKTAEPPAAPWYIFPAGYTPPPEPALQFQPPDSAAQQPATAAASSKPKPAPAMSIAQALGSTSLSKSCVEDFTNVLGKSGFNMGNWAKELVTSVAKTKLQLKAPFGKPKDGDMTSAGLSVGCIKSLPESPAEIQSLLKDIALKAGLNFAAGAAADFAENEDNHTSSKEEPFLESGVLLTEGNGYSGTHFRWSYGWFYNTLGYFQSHGYPNYGYDSDQGFELVLGPTHRWAGETFGFGLFGGLGAGYHDYRYDYWISRKIEFVHELGAEVILGYVSLYLSERNFDQAGFGIGLTFWRDKK